MLFYEAMVVQIHLSHVNSLCAIMFNDFQLHSYTNYSIHKLVTDY